MAYLLGIDVSKWQGDMNWQKTTDAGAKFAFIRAGSIDNTTGKCYTDYQYFRNISLGPLYMPVGCYWYFRPNHDPTKQADYFCGLIGGEDWKLPPVIDLEDDGGLSEQQVTDAAVEFTSRVYDNQRIWCLMYGTAYWLNLHTEYDPIFSEMDLWIARYNPNLIHPWGDADQFPILKPEDWDTWKFWQWTKSASGAYYGAKSAAIDLDYFNGDEDDFQEYLGGQQEKMKIVKVGTERNAVIYDGIDGKREHIIPYGLHFPVLEEKNAPDGRLWYRLGDDWWAVAGAMEIVE